MIDASVNEPALDTPLAGKNLAAPALLVFALALACYLPLLGSAPLAGTEGHRAITAHQMVESGEWLVPRMYGRIYLAKPPLHYWIIGTFEKISGHATPFIWRLPSALEGAALAAMLCLFAGRWFGRIGGLVAGVSYITLITLWGEDRGADIDVTNSLAATLAACCILEIHFGLTRRRIAWAILGGLATGASLMVKGPAGLTIILGALLWVCVDAIRRRRAADLASPATWLPLVIGTAIFATYALLVYRYLISHHWAKDLSGILEAIQDLHPRDWSVRRAFEWITLPIMMFLFSLPVSLALPLALRREVRGEGTTQSRMMAALAGSVLMAWGVNFISGMHVPRYAFVTLPLLCPIAGGVASRFSALRARLKDDLLRIVIGTICLFWGATLVIAVMVWKQRATRGVDTTVAVLATIVAFVSLLPLLRRRDLRGAWGIAALAVLCSIPFGYARHYDRLQRTCLEKGAWLRSMTGPNAHLTTCMMVLDQPDLFYYSGLPTTALDGDMLDWRRVKANSWVVLESPELKAWKAQLSAEQMPTVIPFKANKDNAGFLVWYSDGSMLPPSTQPK